MFLPPKPISISHPVDRGVTRWFTLETSTGVQCRLVGSGALDKRVGRAVCKTSIYLSTNERFHATAFSYPPVNSPGIKLVNDGLRTGRPGSILDRRRDCSVFSSVRTGSGVHQAHIQSILGILSPGIKQPGREAVRSPPSCAEVKNGGAIRSLPHMSSGRDA
jgi:hypothetical protein